MINPFAQLLIINQIQPRLINLTEYICFETGGYFEKADSQQKKTGTSLKLIGN